MAGVTVSGINGKLTTDPSLSTVSLLVLRFSLAERNEALVDTVLTA